MNINEISADLEQQFGKPRNITEENIRFMLSLIKEQSDGEKVNEEVDKPSIDAYGTTIFAVMSYGTTPWEKLAEKPSIRKSLKYIAVRATHHYDEIEDMTKEVLRRHIKGVTLKMVMGFLKIIRALSAEEQPSKIIEYTPFTAHYPAISHGLHQLIHSEHPEDAGAIIQAAIEDGILFPSIPRSVIVSEFNLKKSSFDKYFSRYHIETASAPEIVRKQLEVTISYHRKALRNAIGYTVGKDGKVHFYNRKLSGKSLLSVVIAYCRSVFR